MRIPTSSLDLRRASSLDEALRILHDEEDRAPIAGGTDVYVALEFGTTDVRRYLDVWGLRELREISIRGDVLVIGALATYTTIVRSPDVNARVPMLVEAAKLIGGAQIQNRGTIGGNLANASPAGDTLPVLAAADAVVVLSSVSGQRRIPVMEFFTGYRATARRRDELLVAVEIPRLEGAQWFRKVGTRAAQAISKVVVAGLRSPHPRFALGSVGPTVIRARATEHALANGGSIDDAARVLANEIHPIDDVRSTADYRRTVSVNLLRRFWKDTGN
jgi:xanthine dehydrogenase small subunit